MESSSHLAMEHHSPANKMTNWSGTRVWTASDSIFQNKFSLLGPSAGDWWLSSLQGGSRRVDLDPCQDTDHDLSPLEAGPLSVREGGTERGSAHSSVDGRSRSRL
jgi:hypothetical protein